jgi:hypothetical protein
MLNLIIECTRFERNSIVPVQRGAVKIYVAAVDGGAQEKRKIG